MTTWNELTSQTLQSSNWFPDEFCHAWLDYSNLLSARQPEYDDLIHMRNQLLDEQSVIEQNIVDVESDLSSTRVVIDLNQSQGVDASEELEEESRLESNLSNLENDLSDNQIQLNDNANKINILSNELSMTNNFTTSQLDLIDRFTNTEIWTNENISDPEELLDVAMEYFVTINHPKTNLKISLVDLLKIVDIPDDIKFLDIGTKINIYYKPFNINVQTQVIEMDINYDTGSINLVIANTTKVNKNKKSELADLIYKNDAIVGEVRRDKYKWDKTPELESALFNFLNNKLDAAKHEIVAGANETVTINERGITVTDSEDPLRLIRITNSVIGLIRGGNYVGTAITPDGVWADHLVGKAIIGENLTIADEEGTFEILGNLLKITDRGNVERVLLGEYEDNKFGLKLMNKTGKDVVLDENGMLQSWQEGRSDNVDSNNGLVINIYLPNDTISVRQAILNFKLLPFRAYSKGTESGGSTTQTSSSGGGTSTSTSSGGGTTKTSGSGGDHHHTLFVDNGSVGSSPTIGGYRSLQYNDGGTGGTVQLPKAGTGNISTYSSSGHHTHSISIPNHTHNFSTPNHTHSVSIPNHTHGINYGIYTDTVANNVGIIINGRDRTSALGGRFNSNQSNIDITNYLNIGQWNEIELTSGRLGRIDANIFIQTFMGI